MTPRPPVAWVLNLDAERELETRGRYSRSDHLRAIVGRQSARLLGSLVAPGDVVVTEDSLAGPDGRPRAQGLTGYAWSPTPWALELLRRAGARPVEGPALAVLREVNARPFAADVREPLAEASFEKHVALDIDDALARIALPAPNGWLVRRTFGAAGRGRRRMGGRLDRAEHAWLAASLRLGPLVIEPWVEVTVEYTRSGWVATDGTVLVGAPCFQETTGEGAWVRTTGAAAADVRTDDAHLAEAVEGAGRALARAGYAGPFGIDAFRYRDERGSTTLNPISEINARFTMDWTSTMELPRTGAEVDPTLKQVSG